MKSLISATLLACSVLALSGCVVTPVTNPTPTATTEDWGISLSGRGLQRPGEFVNFYSNGTFVWDGPNGRQTGTWTGGPNRLCLNVNVAGGVDNLCGVAYLTNGQLEFLSDRGGAPIYWTIV